MFRNLSLQPPQFAELPATFYSSVNPEPLNRPYWVAFNPSLAEALGLDEDFQTASNLAYLSGSAERYRPQPLATVYSGHQFGAYTPRLGDGRALLLGDSEDRHGRRWEWQLKGAGKTPYSRFADGRAVLRGAVALRHRTADRLLVLNLPGRGIFEFRLRLPAEPHRADAFGSQFGPWHLADHTASPRAGSAAPLDSTAIRYRVF